MSVSKNEQKSHGAFIVLQAMLLIQWLPGYTITFITTDLTDVTQVNHTKAELLLPDFIHSETQNFFLFKKSTPGGRYTVIVKSACLWLSVEVILHSDLERYVDEKSYRLTQPQSELFTAQCLCVAAARTNKATEHIWGYEMKAERAAQVL